MQDLLQQLTGIRESFAFFIPEMMLFAGIIIIFVAGMVRRSARVLFAALASGAAAGSFFFLVSGETYANFVLFSGMLQREGFGGFLMALVDVSVVLTCVLPLRGEDRQKTSEYFALILAVALGSHLLLMSTNLVMVFLSLELVSISSYVLAGYAMNRAGSEGSLKYFLFGASASAIMLYGFSLLYGMTGTTDLTSPEFFEGMMARSSPLVLVAGFMSLSGFLFKMGAAPMHAWAPDVYQAAPMPVIAFLSVAPKLAGLGILARFTVAMNLYGQAVYDWQLILAAIVILTLTVGNFSALWQKDPKRMMAYSSIAQSGFLLLGVVIFHAQGLPLLLFYATVYLLMNFAVFAFLSFFEGEGISSMAEFSGKGGRHLIPAVGLTLALVALTGLPPTGGFTAKLLIFSGLWESYLETHKTLLIWLLAFGLLNTVVSLFFYLRIPYYAFIKAGGGAVPGKKMSFENLLGVILVVVVIAIFFVPGLLMGLINRINFAL